MRRMTAALAAIPILLNVASVEVGVAAVPPRHEAVKELAQEYQETKRELVDSEAQKRKILGSLYTINRRMKKITKEKGHLTQELMHVQDNVQNIARLIANLEAQIEKQRKLLRKRLRALYKLSGQGYLRIVFSQMNSHELDETLKFLKIITDADYRLIRNYQENVAVYRKQRKRLKTQVQRLVVIERKIRTQEGLLVKEHKAKTRIVSRLEADRAMAMNKIKTIRRQTKGLRSANGNLDDVIGDLLKPSFFERKGQLPAPIAGSMVQDFGLISDHGFKIQISHKGWHIRAEPGTAVTAVFGGSIVHASWTLGYGNMLIVDHGDHYYTVYGHVVNPRVRLGDEVKRGQTIAEAGESSQRFGPGLYFEIRHFSEPENPVEWITRGELPVAGMKESEEVELATAPHLGTQ